MGGVGDKGRGGWKPEVARQEKKWAISEIKSESREREKSVSYSDGCKALWAGPMFVQVQPWRLEQPSHNAAYSPLYHAFRPPFILLCFLTPTRLPLSILDNVDFEFFYHNAHYRRTMSAFLHTKVRKGRLETHCVHSKSNNWTTRNEQLHSRCILQAHGSENK